VENKKEIVTNWLPRYTGTALDKFGKYILLTNFGNYVDMFAKRHNVPVVGIDRPMPNATSNDITIINFGMGSANAATVMDLLSAFSPSCLFLGKCGGLKKKNKLGDLILPIAAIRGEGTSSDYLPLKSQLCLPSVCRRRFPQLSGIMAKTIGPERFIPQTGVSGNMIKSLNPTC